MFRGTDPDVPATLIRTLDSDYLAFLRSDVSPVFADRVQHDPRFTIVHDAGEVLVRVERARMADVRFTRVDTTPCGTATTVILPHAAPQSWEFAPYGPSRLAIDGRPVVSTTAIPGAILGRGYRFALPPASASQRIDVTTCRAPDAIAGFYLVRR